jgi:predicted small lipoprotein YifL
MAAALLIGLGACGKKGSLYPPEERAEEFTYPTVYPAPESVLPQGAAEEDETAGEGSAAP